jgi:hypothetical protein
MEEQLSDTSDGYISAAAADAKPHLESEAAPIPAAHAEDADEPLDMPSENAQGQEPADGE